MLAKLNVLIISLLFTLLLVVAPNTQAKSINIDEVTSKVASAYGGEKLTSLPAITIHHYRKNLFTDQSAPAQTPEFWRFNEELTIDFINKRKSLVSWRVNKTNKDLEKFLVADNSARIYDITNKKYHDDNWYNYTNTGSTIERSSDTLIARKILTAPQAVSSITQVQYQGEAHYQIELPLSGKTPSRIYINQASGLINKVARTHPSAGELTTVFSNHSTVDSIAFARDMSFFIGETPRVVSTYRMVDIQPNLAAAFAKPANFSAWGEALVSENVTVRQLANSVFHVGKGHSHTLFIDAGEFFIASGGDGKLASNFEYLQQHLKTTKPLKYAVLSHHHSRQLNMLEPALNLGAKIITVASNLTAIENKLNKGINNDSIILVDKSYHLLDGTITIHDIATAHADHNLVTYLANEKILYAEHHYEVLYQQGNPRGFKNMVIFANKLKALNIDANTLVNGASARILSGKEFTDTVNSYIKPTCPKTYSVCQQG